MRNLQAQLEGESRSVAGWRPVRNLRAHNSHSASSSSGSKVNALCVQAGRNPEQVASQLKSDVHLSRNSDCDKHNSARSSTQKWVETFCKGSEYPMLTDKPFDEANESVKGQSSTEHEPKSVSALSVPCQSNFLKDTHAPWYVGSSAPERERRSSSPHHSELGGGAEDADGLRRGAGANQKSHTPKRRTKWCIREKRIGQKRSLEQNMCYFMDESLSNSHQKCTSSANQFAAWAG